MPSELRVVDQRFLAKLNNGDNFDINDTTDFATHLKGGVLEEIRAIFNVQVEWYTRLSSYNWLWDSAAGTARIEKSGLNFPNEGFSVGDTVKLSQAGVGVEGVVTSISVGEIILGSAFITRGSVDDGYYIDTTGPDPLTGISAQTALKYKFGLIENLEPTNTLSKLTNTDQIYLFQNIDHMNPLTFVQGTSFGNNKAWVTGSARVAFVGLSFDKDYNDHQETTQEFQIEHTFKINPAYRDGEEDSLEGIDVPPQDIFNGDKSLKYIFQAEFRTVLNNPNTTKESLYDPQLGSVGYFNESFNGYENNYSSENLVYQIGGVNVDQIEVGNTTNVTYTIKSSTSSFLASTAVIVGHTAIINSLAYTNSPDNYQDTWTDETLRTITGAGAANGTLIKNFTATFVNSTTIDISFDVQFTGAQNARLESGQRYVLYYTIQDPNPALTVDTGDKTTNIVETNFYNKNTDIPGLFEVLKLEQYPHPEAFQLGVSQGFTNALTFNESGMMADVRFALDNTAVLESLKFDIVVFNPALTEWSVLRSYEFDLSGQVVVNGIQQIEVDSTRGFVLIEDDIFNYVKITTDNNDGTDQFYNLQVGYKMPWQDWLEFPNAPEIFYDPSKNFNGFTQKISEYSLVGTTANSFTDGDNGTFEDNTPAGWGLTILNTLADEIGLSFTNEADKARTGLVSMSVAASKSAMAENPKIYKVIENDNGLPVVVGNVYVITAYIALRDILFEPSHLDNGSIYYMPNGYDKSEVIDIKFFEIITENLYSTEDPLPTDYRKITTTFRAKTTESLQFTIQEDLQTDILVSTGFTIDVDDITFKQVEYDIRVLLDGVISQNGIDTNYVTASEEIDVFDYNSDDQSPDAFSCVINTYNEAGFPLENNIIEEQFTELRARFTPLVPPSFSESVDFTEVANEWNRFAHGSKYDLVPIPGTGRQVDWDNQQANDTDVFINTQHTLSFNKNEPTELYNSTSSQILSTANMGAFYGCYSIDEFEFYDISGKMFSNEGDNDTILYQIAFMVDEQGIEHTLSLAATTGGLLMDRNPSYTEGQTAIDIFEFNPTGADAFCTVALVYDYGKDGFTQLDVFHTSQSVVFWSAVGDLSFIVKRSGDNITAEFLWDLDGVGGNDQGTTFNFNLDSNPLTEKFKGFSNIGFGFHSQQEGGFKDVVLTKPGADFYGVLRMESELAPSDFNINELSTIIEAPEGNLLTNLTGTEKKATLSFDGTDFIVQGQIDTSQLTDGENYRFSAELRSINLEV